VTRTGRQKTLLMIVDWIRILDISGVWDWGHTEGVNCQHPLSDLATLMSPFKMFSLTLGPAEDDEVERIYEKETPFIGMLLGEIERAALPTYSMEEVTGAPPPLPPPPLQCGPHTGEELMSPILLSPSLISPLVSGLRQSWRGEESQPPAIQCFHRYRLSHNGSIPCLDDIEAAVIGHSSFRV
jgi:hypothetical protein